MPDETSPTGSLPELARQVDTVEVTEEQRARFLQILADDKMCGDAKALRQAGVAGTTGQLRAYIRDHLADDTRDARGWSITKVENALFEVATNTEHPSFERAAGRILKAYHPAYRDSQHLEVTGREGKPLEVTVEHDYDRLLDKLAHIGLVQRGPAAALDAPDQRLLPARTD